VRLPPPPNPNRSLPPACIKQPPQPCKPPRSRRFPSRTSSIRRPASTIAVETPSSRRLLAAVVHFPPLHSIDSARTRIKLISGRLQLARLFILSFAGRFNLDGSRTPAVSYTFVGWRIEWYVDPQPLLNFNMRQLISTCRFYHRIQFASHPSVKTQALFSAKSKSR